MFGKKKKDGDKKSEKKERPRWDSNPQSSARSLRLRLRRPTPYPLGHKDIQPILGDKKFI